MSGCCSQQGFLGAQSWRETLVLQSSQEGEYVRTCVIHILHIYCIPLSFHHAITQPDTEGNAVCDGLGQVQDQTPGPAIHLSSHPPFLRRNLWAKPNTQVGQLFKNGLNKHVSRYVLCCLWMCATAPLLMGWAVLWHMECGGLALAVIFPW